MECCIEKGNELTSGQRNRRFHDRIRRWFNAEDATDLRELIGDLLLDLNSKLEIIEINNQAAAR